MSLTSLESLTTAASHRRAAGAATGAGAGAGAGGGVVVSRGCTLARTSLNQDDDPSEDQGTLALHCSGGGLASVPSNLPSELAFLYAHHSAGGA